MSEFNGVRYTGRAVPTVKRVTTYRQSSGRVVQSHHGFYGIAWVQDGPRNGAKCGHFHQKRQAAIECAERTARAIIREGITP